MSSNYSHNCSYCPRSYQHRNSLNRHIDRNHIDQSYSFPRGRSRSRSQSPSRNTRSCKECSFKDREIDLLKSEIENLRSQYSQAMSLLETVLKSQSSFQMVEAVPVSSQSTSLVDTLLNDGDDGVDFDSLFSSSN